MMAIIIGCFFIYIILKVFTIQIGNGNAEGHRDIDSRDSRRQMISMAMEKAEDYNAFSFQVGRSWIGEDGHEYVDCSITVDDDVAMALAYDLRDEYGDVIEKIGITRNKNINSNMNSDKQRPQVIIINENNGTVNGDYHNNSDRNQHSDDDAEYAEYEEVVEDEAAEVDDSEHIIDKLTPIFYGNRENAARFLVSIRNMKPIQICGKVRLLVRQKVISDISYQKDLWQILHDHKLYNLSRRNWNKHVM